MSEDLNKIEQLIKTGNPTSLLLAKQLSVSIGELDSFFTICFAQRDLYKDLVDACIKEATELYSLQREYVFQNDKIQVLKERESVYLKRDKYQARFDFYNDFLNDVLN